MGSKRKKYYKGAGSGKKYKGAELQQGAVGFLFSFTKDRERQAKAEAYELLNSYADDLPGAANQDEKNSDSSDEGSDEDIEAALQRQLTKLKQKKSQDRFTYLVTGVNQILFMKASVSNHHNLTYRMLEDAKKGQLRSENRALNRMLPVLASCRAELGKVGECVLAAVDVYLTTDNLSLPSNITYKSMVKVRNNNDEQLTQMHIINTIGEAIRERHKDWRVNLSDPYLYIIVDILKTVCCVSVVHGFVEYRKFNLHELKASHHTAQAMAATDSRVKSSGEKTTVADDPSKIEPSKVKDPEIKPCSDTPTEGTAEVSTEDTAEIEPTSAKVEETTVSNSTIPNITLPESTDTKVAQMTENEEVT